MRVFLEIARTGGVRSAAQHLLLSQSAVTKTLAQLESEHGVLLFNRTGKGLLLTETGEKFRPCAEAVLRRTRLGRVLEQSNNVTLQCNWKMSHDGNAL